MEFISHRLNKKEELLELEKQYGVEIDLRDDLNGNIYMEHDPFRNGEKFEEYLKVYEHGIIILNVKSERIEWKILQMLRKYNIKNYFFLDSSFPMIKLLSDMGEENLALRFSEFEGMDTIRNMAGKVKWIWVDCFTKLPIDKYIYLEFKKMKYKICIVSPELQGQSEKIEEYALYLKENNIIPNAICTKSYNIDKWKSILE
jgi:hypothetical protein